MAQAYPLPKWGVTMEEGTIAEWIVQPGEAVKVDQLVAQVETDKISVEYVAPTSGIVAAHLVEEGATVACGEYIIVIATDQQDYDEYRASHGG